MSALRSKPPPLTRFLRISPAPSPLSSQDHPADIVVPVHYFDANSPWRQVIVDLTFRFDAQMDVDRLQGALERLLAKEGWRKAGARLRINEQGRLEYHIPASFSPTRPGVNFTHSHYSHGIASDPLGKILPNPSGPPPGAVPGPHPSKRPTISPSPSAFEPLTRSPTAPNSLVSLLKSDAPLLAVHIATFANASLVTLTFPHVFADGFGIAQLLRAWAALAAGRDADVPPVHAAFATADPLADIGTAVPADSFTLADDLLGGWRGLAADLRIKISRWWWPRDELRVVRMPAAFVRRLREDAVAELSATTSTTAASVSTGEKPFVSDADVLAAWWTATVVRAARLSPRRTVLLAMGFGARKALEVRGAIPAGAAYLGNALFGVFALFRAGDLARDGGAGRAAGEVRRAVSKQAGAGQVEAQAALWRRSLSAKRMMPAFGDSSNYFFLVSNASQCGYFELDFSGAVRVGDSVEEAERRRKGTPTYMHINTFAGAELSNRNTFLVYGKDAGGNYWASGFLREGLWAKVDRYINELSRGSD